MDPKCAILARRGIRIDPKCAICATEDEDAGHFLFQCPFARMCWLISPLAIRSHRLTGEFSEILCNLLPSLSDDQWTVFTNSIWAIWHCRNEMVYVEKQPTTSRFLQLLHEISTESLLASTMHKKVPNTLPQTEDVVAEYSCFVDGSWKEGWIGGVGYGFIKDGLLVAYCSAREKVCCPFQSEARSLMRAVEYARGEGMQSCVFYTNNTTLSEVISSSNIPDGIDWRGYKEVMTVWILWKYFKASPALSCCYKSRDQNSFADYLAKKGRTEGWNVTGYTFPILDSEYF